jgi:aspartyl-tRNA(Asn)/glutamyl-tRNA(Gln) amidotransferase subunit A
VLGLKPTFPRVGRSGDIFGTGTVSHIGPLGQSTTDLVDALLALSDADPNDPMSDWVPDRGQLSSTLEAALGRGVNGCRVGVVRSEWEAADPTIVSLCESALTALESEGAVLVDVEHPTARMAMPAGVATIGVETLAGLLDDRREYGTQMGDDLRMLLNLLASIPAGDVGQARRVRTRLRRDTAAVLAGVDVLALPSVAGPAPAFPLADTRRAVIDDSGNWAMCRFMFLANLTGLPAGSVPVGLVDGTPVGLQILGDAWDEASVVAVMAHLERLGVARLPRPPGYRALAADLSEALAGDSP